MMPSPNVHAMGQISAARLLLLCAAARVIDATNFLLASTGAAAPGHVWYVAMPSAGLLKSAGTPQKLISDGLLMPYGLAVDQRRRMLFVADGDPGKIYRYQLVVNGETLSVGGPQTFVTQKNLVRWISLDGVGNLFFTVEETKEVYMLTSEDILAGTDNAKVIYKATEIQPNGQTPAGIAVDNFHVFWTNKDANMGLVDVSRADQLPATPGAVDSVAQLVPHTAAQGDSTSDANNFYGICIALGNVFYSGEKNAFYGVKKGGGTTVKIGQNPPLSEPRGCAFDGDGTVFVADKGNNAVYSFAGNMHTLVEARLTKVADMETPWGLAVLSRASRWPGPLLALLGASAAVLHGVA